jgi:prophage DNA circulation protein
MPDPARLKQASFRNLPFAVENFGGEHGRRLAEHEYPDRDVPWAEDLGRRKRSLRVRGFLLSNSPVYGGGDVGDQLQRMIGAAEAKGSGPLVHPVLGALTVNCRSFVHESAADGDNFIAIAFDFIEGGVRTFPTTQAATGSVVNSAAASAQSAARTSFAGRARAVLPKGASVIQAAQAVATPWAQQAVGLGQDATSLVKLASRLSGNNGRYFNGGNLGGFGALSGALSAPLRGGQAGQAAAVAQLVVRQTGLRTVIGAAGADLVTKVASLAS